MKSAERNETSHRRENQDSVSQLQISQNRGVLETQMEKLTQPKDNAITAATKSTNRTSDDDDVRNSTSSSSCRPSKSTRRRYSRTQLMKLNENVKLKDPPDGYNPAVLSYRSAEGMKEGSGGPGGGGGGIREGVPPKWNRSTSMGANWQGTRGGSGGGRTQGLQYSSRLIEGVDDQSSTNARNRMLRSTVSWHEDRSSTTPPDRTFSRRNSRSDQPGRWDNNKDEMSSSLEKRPSHGPERWPSYGHRDMKEKQQKSMREEYEETETLFPPPPSAQQFVSDQDPPWMHHQESKNSERAEQHRRSAAEFEQKRKEMRETLAKEKQGNTASTQENAMFMTDEEINKYKKELEAEDRGVTSSSAVYTFDSLKEALKSQGVSNLPPMPTSGMNTVDQIEKSMKASAVTSQPTMSEIERQKLELLKMTGTQTGPTMGQNATSGNFESANLLLSMLRGQNRPPQTGVSGVLPTGQGHHQQQQMAFSQINLPQQQQQQQQQQQLLAAGGTPLERFFTGNQRPGGLQPNVGNLGLGFGVGQNPQQPMGLPPGLGAVNIPYMQQANPQGQLNPRVPAMQQQNPLLSALIANQAQQTVQQRAKQAQMMAHLKQAQQQMALPNSRPIPAVAEHDFGMNSSRSAPTPGNEREQETEVEQPQQQQQQPTGNVPPQLPLHSFGLAGQGGTTAFMGSRPQIPGVGMINPAMMGGQMQPGMFQGGGGGLTTHPSLFMQNGGGLARPTGAPGLNPLAFSAMRPNPGAADFSGLLENRQAQMSLLGMAAAPPQNQGMNLQATMLAAQQQQQGTSGLNRFFAMNNLNAGVNPSFPAAAAAAAGGGGAELVQGPGANEPASGRGRSLEELKNEAQ